MDRDGSQGSWAKVGSGQRSDSARADYVHVICLVTFYGSAPDVYGLR